MKSIFATVLALPLLAVATPVALEARGESGGNCDTGTLQCCQQTQSSISSAMAGLLGILGPIDGLLGVDCTPITVIGGDNGSKCTANPLCCANEAPGQNGINFASGCVPVSV